MRNKYLAIIVTSMLLFSSCENFLETSSPSIMTPDLVFNDQSMVEKTLLGVYSKLTEDATYSQDLAITLNCGSDVEIRAFSLGQPAQSTDRAAANYLATAGNRQITRMTEALYAAIERANMLINGIEAGEAYKSGEAAFIAMHGEAIVLRAMCYRDLIRHLGNVPFKLEPTKTDLSNVYMPKTDRFEIMESLIDQLVTYAHELPWKQPTPERITQGFARGLAAQLALMRAGWNYSTNCEWIAPQEDANDYYVIAKEQTEKVINSGEYSLTPSFKDLFYNLCQRRYLPNESLYEVGFVVARSSELGYTIGPRIITSTTTYGYATQGQIYTTPEYFYSFHPEDERRDVSVYYTEYRDISNTGTYPNGVLSTTGISENIISNPQQFRVGKWDATWCPSDFAAASYAAGGKIGTGINYCMMRYSDILLMYAEAENAINGMTTSAKDALWKVRSRAIPTLSFGEFEQYLTTKTFIEAIEDERRWEFLGEGSRKWDLMRWGKLPQAIIDMRRINNEIFLNWTYDFEFKTKTMTDGTVVNRELPTELYYKYDSNNELIEDINIDYSMLAAPSIEYKTASLGGVWLYRLRTSSTAQENFDDYLQFLTEFASGIVDGNGTPVLNGRPFQPLPGTMVVDYNGVISQDYGFTNN